MTKSQEELGRLQFNARLERLNRAYSLNAPPILLYQIVDSLQRALWLIDPDSCADEDRRKTLEMIKVRGARCQYNGCGEPIDTQSIGLCETHQKEFDEDSEYECDF